MNTLAEVFEAVYKQEFSEFDDPPKHFFSLRHRRAMKKILAVSSPAPSRKLTIKKRIIIVMLVILLSLLGIAAGAQISKSFAFDEIKGKTYLFAVNDKNAPTEISTLYHLPTVPDGFELFYEDYGTYNALVIYDGADEKSLFFDQSVKNGFSIGYDADRFYFEETKMNGFPAYFICYYDGGGVIVWDNEDYILEVGGDFTKDELIAFAESVEPKGE